MKYVRDLSRDQLNELKQSYKIQLEQDGDFSYEELVNAENTYLLESFNSDV